MLGRVKEGLNRRVGSSVKQFGSLKRVFEFEPRECRKSSLVASPITASYATRGEFRLVGAKP